MGWAAVRASLNVTAVTIVDNSTALISLPPVPAYDIPSPETVVLVGHSHLMREMCRAMLDPGFLQREPKLAADLRSKLPS